MAFTHKVLSKARTLTSDNHHQEAVKLLADHFKLPAISKAVQGVMMIHEARGRMDQPMSEMMHTLRSELCAAVEAAHGPEMANKVYHCM